MPRRWIIVSLLLAAMCFQDTVYTRSGELRGVVLLPAIKVRKSISRRNVYRGRIGPGETDRRSNRSSFLDVIVSARPLDGAPDIRPLEGVKILQRDATFRPRVTVVTPGSEVQFINLDRFFHNVFSLTPGASFNIGRRATGSVVSRRIEQAGKVQLFCDIHSQMNAIILCVDTPYFTRADRSGRFRLQDLPPGEYEISVFHPDLPPYRERVRLEAEESYQRVFDLRG